jgi:hypothetical protein
MEEITSNTKTEKVEQLRFLLCGECCVLENQKEQTMISAPTIY